MNNVEYQSQDIRWEEMDVNVFTQSYFTFEGILIEERSCLVEKI